MIDFGYHRFGKVKILGYFYDDKAEKPQSCHLIAILCHLHVWKLLVSIKINSFISTRL